MAFLSHAGYRMAAVYGRQFQKMLQHLAEHFVPALEAKAEQDTSEWCLGYARCPATCICLVGTCLEQCSAAMVTVTSGTDDIQWCSQGTALLTALISGTTL